MTELIPTIVEEVRDETEREMRDLPPLNEAVDGDALVSVADDVDRIEFEYADCTVVIRDGDVERVE
jgi:hypothetical protein